MKIAVISGASSGIGLEIAKELDKYGLDQMWLISRSLEKLTAHSSDFKTQLKFFPLDLSNNDSFDEILSQYNEEKPEIEYLVCSAGVGFNGDFEKISRDETRKMVDLNVRALTTLTSISIPYMKSGGKIIEIASSAGFLPQPSFAVYAATKSYVISFSRGLNYELKERNISVTAVCPGPVETPFFSGLEGVKEYKKKYAISPKKVAVASLKAAKKSKAVCIPTFSMKMVQLASKIVPTSLILKFYK